MTRARQGKMVAGVCAGLARATGTDPVLFRVILTVLAFFGGIGALLYVIAWLLLPAEDEQVSPVESLLGRGSSGTAPALTIGLIALGALLLAGALSDSFRNSFLLVVCLAAGVLLLRRTVGTHGTPPGGPAPDGGPSFGGPGFGGPGFGGPGGGGPGGGWGGPAGGPGGGEPTPGTASYGTPQAGSASAPEASPAAQSPAQGPEPDGTPTGPAQAAAAGPATADSTSASPVSAAAGPASTVSAEADPVSATAAAPDVSEPPTAPAAPAWTYPAASSASSTWTSATTATTATTTPPHYTPPFAPYGPYGSFEPGRPAAAVRPTPPPPAGRKRRRKERSILGRLTFSLACLALVVLSIVDAAGVSIPFTAYAALALTVVTLGLFVGVWLGRARKLIPLGILLTLVLAAGSGVENIDGSRGIHDVTAAPTTATAVQPSYDVGVGDLSLDLSAVKFPGDREIKLDGGLGDIRVIVPTDVNVDVTYDVGLGDASIFDDHQSGPGVHNQAHHTGTGGSAANTLTLDIHQGVGDVNVGVQ